MNGKGSLLVAVALAVAMLGRMAPAQSVFVWNPPCNSDGLWSTVGNWMQDSAAASRFPGDCEDGDSVFILDSNIIQPTLDVSVEVAILTLDSPDLSPEMLRIDNTTLIVGATDGLTVLMDAVLRIEGGAGKLILPTATCAGHVVEGDISLENATAGIVIDAEVTLDGLGIGRIVSPVGGTITVMTGDKLTIENLVIEGGELVFQGSGMLHNATRIRAVGGDITFGADLTLTDVGDGLQACITPRWQVDFGFVMQFDNPFSLLGDFAAADGGTFAFTDVACYVTTGGLSYDEEQLNECPDPEDPPLDIASGGGFRFKDSGGGDQQCGTCP